MQMESWTPNSKDERGPRQMDRPCPKVDKEAKLSQFFGFGCRDWAGWRLRPRSLAVPASCQLSQPLPILCPQSQHFLGCALAPLCLGVCRPALPSRRLCTFPPFSHPPRNTLQRAPQPLSVLEASSKPCSLSAQMKSNYL